jgi:hypothetical protein
MSIARSADVYNRADLLTRCRQLKGHGRAYVLSTLINNSDPETLIELVTETLDAIRSNTDQADRAQTVLYLTPFLVEELKNISMSEPPPGIAARLLKDIRSLFEESLPVLARKTRHEMLREMHTIAPAIVAISNERAISEIVQAIRDVGRWWP